MCECCAPKVPFGQVVITAGANEVLTDSDVYTAFKRHRGGDWGYVSAEDRDANERALREGSRLLSVYRSQCGITFWVITEADRSATTVLLPSDY